MIGGELPYLLYKYLFCRVVLTHILKRLSIQYSEQNKRNRLCGSDFCFTQHSEAVAWMKHISLHQLYWFSGSTENVYGRSSKHKHMEYPPEIINLFKMFHNNFECSIILGNIITKGFPVKSGKHHGCTLSPILFLVTIDCVMRETTSERPCGIQWTLFSHLQDIGFASDIAIL